MQKIDRQARSSCFRLLGKENIKAPLLVNFGIKSKRGYLYEASEIFDSKKKIERV